MIRSAKISQIKDILSITEACRWHMESQGIFQWTKDYPSSREFTKDIAANELYCLWVEKRLIGCIAISESMDTEYESVQWLTPNHNNLYVHRLAVHPRFQGRGYAQRLMDFAEERAKKNGHVSIRLDTFGQNKRNQRFYEQRGYQRLEPIYFPLQSTYPFYCYELVL